MIISDPVVDTMIKEVLHIDAIGIKKATFLVRAVNHPVRQSMLRAISREEPITVTALRLQFNLNQPTASSHLSVLRRAGVVTTRRKGHRVFYSIDHDRMERLQQKLQDFFATTLFLT